MRLSGTLVWNCIRHVVLRMGPPDRPQILKASTEIRMLGLNDVIEID